MLRMSCCLLAILTALSGCATLEPPYKRPAAPVPSSWPSGPAYRKSTAAPAGASVAGIPWREFFIDPQLRKVIALALENNRDLRIALLDIERSRAQYRIQRSDLFPKVDAAASGSAQRVPEGFSGTDGGDTLHQYRVDLGVASYELDLFGRVRSLEDQALEQYLATEEAQRATRIALVSEVAANYLTLAADREALQLAKETLANQESAYLLVKSRFEAGVASALDLDQARTSVETARIDIARYTSLTAQDENALDLVVGARVASRLLPQSLSQTVTPLKEISPELPSEVLLRRPDILQAEHELKGANANIGAARAAFFPRITLVSSVGTGSDELTGLFGGGSLAWNFAPQVTLPIFTAGANRANLDVSKVDRKIAVARYEKAIQTAFREVSDALAVKGTIDEQTAAQQSLTDTTAEAYRLSTARYKKGVASYLDVLDSQRSLYSAQQNLIGVRLAGLTNQVTLYQVLGGGYR